MYRHAVERVAECDGMALCDLFDRDRVHQLVPEVDVDLRLADRSLAPAAAFSLVPCVCGEGVLQRRQAQVVGQHGGHTGRCVPVGVGKGVMLPPFSRAPTALAFATAFAASSAAACGAGGRVPAWRGPAATLVIKA